MPAATKKTHTATLPDGVRVSKNSTLAPTHIVAAKDANGWFVAAWCGNVQLATKAARRGECETRVIEVDR